ncbi:MAG: hypothetical protein E7052_00285 [Lentisphaerae bacterium]|nr:hypothetical protein [Lentisphaerota bacterium]
MIYYHDLPHNIAPVIPWWTFNGYMTEAESCRQLDDFCSKGISEFFIYPNFGLEYPDFLSDNWFEFIAFLLQECKVRGLRFWIYDELNWPSGSAGGRMADEHPEYLMRTMRRQDHPLQPGESWQPEPDAEYIWCGVFDNNCTAPTEIAFDQIYINRSDQKQTIMTIEKVLINDNFLCSMGISNTRNQRGIMDALNPAAVRCWMQYNYLPYAEHFPSELGKTIRGFFYDEPTMVSPFHTGDLPWTPDLEEAFSARYNYSCRELYWSLFYPAADLTGCNRHILQFRYDFWRLVSGRFAEAFAQQLSEWCSEHGLLFSGHNWPEEVSCQRLMITTVGDIFYQQQYLHVPGTDFLFFENCFALSAGMNPGEAKWARNLIYSARHPVSVARYNGAVHTICESSACLGKNGSSPAVQKKMYDFLYAMGISLMNPARAYDFTDFRKYAVAQDAAQPYWEHYRHFVDYMRIMSNFNSRGHIDAQIAVLNAVSGKFAFSDIAADTSIRQERTPLEPLGDAREATLSVLDALVRNHRDFELIFEDIVLNSHVGSDGTLLAPNSAFKVIILPNCSALDDAVWSKLSEFAQAGGVVITVGNAPFIPLKHDHTALNVQTLPSVNVQLDEKFPENLLRFVTAAVPEKYTLHGEKCDEVLTLLRSSGDWHGLLVVNGTAGSKTLELTGDLTAGIRSVVDSCNGRCYRWLPGKKFVLPENGAFLLTGDEPPADAPGFPAELQCVQALDDLLWQCGNRVRNTMLMALECTCNGKTLALDDDGACEVKLDPETADSVLLHGRFTVRDRVPEDLRIWFEKADFAELKVNGHALLECNSEFLFAPENVSVPIGQYCHLGVNEVTVRVPLSPWMRDRHGLRIHFHMLMQGCQPLVLMGTFAAEGDHTIAALPEKFHAGALEVQGFGMFADKLTLSSSFDAPEWQVVTHLAIADTLLPLAVELNGVALGVRFWQNEALCIPENVLKASGNQLKITLYGEMKNMLGRGWLGGKIPKTPFILPTFELTREIY